MGVAAFGHYQLGGKCETDKEMARIFSAALKSFSWKKVKTACRNNRPQL